MIERLAVVCRCTLLGIVWGALSAKLYDTELLHGLMVGVSVWGLCSFVAVPGPFAPSVDELVGLADFDEPDLAGAPVPELVIDLVAIEREEAQQRRFSAS